MKKAYIFPDLDIIAFTLNNVCGDVIHTSKERGGVNSGWEFDGDDDNDAVFGEMI